MIFRRFIKCIQIDFEVSEKSASLQNNRITVLLNVFCRIIEKWPGKKEFSLPGCIIHYSLKPVQKPAMEFSLPLKHWHKKYFILCFILVFWRKREKGAETIIFVLEPSSNNPFQYKLLIFFPHALIKIGLMYRSAFHQMRWNVWWNCVRRKTGASWNEINWSQF